MPVRLLAASLLVASCGSAAAPSTAASAPTATGTAPSGLPAAVIAVLDGDSLRVSLGATNDEVRLLGINAPEADECYAAESRAALAAEAGAEVTIVAPTGGARDQFGRLLAYAYSGNRNINLSLVANGAAVAIAADHPLRPEFTAADEEAWERGVGMWAPGTCRASSEYGVFFFDITFDAPGRDDESPNGEYVVLGNSGPSLDLSGWVLRDESSTHRFRFPEGTIVATGEFLFVRSGCGDDSPGDLHWCASGSVWNNDGDTAMLVDDTGAIVARMRYLGN